MKSVKLLRILQDISQWELSQEAGIPNYRLSLIENGKCVPDEVELLALARSLKTKVEVLKNPPLFMTHVDEDPTYWECHSDDSSDWED